MDIAEAQRKAAIKKAAEHQKKARKDLSNFIGKRLPSAAKGGKVMPLKLYPDDALTTVCDLVYDFGPDLQDLISSMATTMYLTGGVGLAANQVGVLRRVFVCDVRAGTKDAKDEFRVFVNPVILTASDELVKMREGCLSFPGVRENIERPHSVFVQAFTPNGQPFETTLIDIEARIALHEIDHLNGITWLDHMGSMQKKIATKRAKKVKRGIEHDMKSEEMARRTRSRQSQGRRNSRSRFT